MKKVFVNAEDFGFLFQHPSLALGVILVLPLLSLPFIGFKLASDPSTGIIGIIPLAFILIVYFLLIIWGADTFEKKTGFFLIETDDKDIYARSLFKKIKVDWSEITEVKTYEEENAYWEGFIKKGSQVKLKTPQGIINFSVMMKEKDAPYPKLKKYFWGGKNWVDENGVEKPINVENCPLYIEIQKHLPKPPA